MAFSPKTRLWAAGLALAACLALVEAFARRVVTTTPARQALARYVPEGENHAVFLGSSLTDASVDAGLLDSLLGARSPGFRAFNLALAGLSGSENYYLLYKRFILPRSRPAFLVVEAAGIPFLPSAGPFRLEGQGLRVETFRSELIEYGDFLYLSGGFPGLAPSLSYWLHKTWFSYHYRLEIQARLRERLPAAWTGSAPPPRDNPYRMVDQAPARFGAAAREELKRLEAMPEGPRAMRLREAHFLDLAALARENGSTLIVLRPPLPPSDVLTAASPAFAAYQGAFARLCDSLGVVYLDLSREEACRAHAGASDGASPGSAFYTYSDGIHLDASGARKFTACLGARMGERLAPVSRASSP